MKSVDRVSQTDPGVSSAFHRQKINYCCTDVDNKGNSLRSA